MCSLDRRMTRRRFLKHAAAAAAAPCVISPFALGGDGRTAPSDKIVMGFIGVGRQGGGHVGRFSSMRDVQVVAVCDVDSRLREAKKNEVEKRYARDREKGAYKGCAAYNDFRKIIDRDDIDAVLIGTPDHWHAIPSVMAAKSGKDVYCEKPLSLTIREARAMVDAVRRYGRVFQTGSQQRSAPNYRLACELVRSGRIGKVQSAHVKISGWPGLCDLPAETCPPELDWNMWIGPAPWRPYNKKLHPYSWRPYRDFSGGGTANWGAHAFDIVQWGLGMDESGPVEIYPPGKEHRVLTFRYESGVLLQSGGAEFRTGYNGVLFKGTDGTIEVNRGGKLVSTPEDIVKEPLGPDDVRLYDSPNHYADFLDCIRTRKRPICDVEVGCRTVSVCHLGNIAYWLGRPLRWDPAKEEFVGDDEANRWVDRPRRAPWRL